MSRELAEAAFRDAVTACDPVAAVAAVTQGLAPAHRIRAFAIGKAAGAMARGLGRVAEGIIVAPNEVAGPPDGWRAVVAGHPQPDERSLKAARAVCALVDGAGRDDVVVALVSGGASALVAQPRIPLHAQRGLTNALMAAGAPIDELNAVRAALSTVKGGQLVAECRAVVHTFVLSDVIGDRIDVVGSGPTIGPWLATPGVAVDFGASLEYQRHAAVDILERYGVAIPPVLAIPFGERMVVRTDTARLVLAMRSFADALAASIAHRGVAVSLIDEPMSGPCEELADRLAMTPPTTIVAWGEPTPVLPPSPGVGGRAQQLALELARRIRGTQRAAFVAGSDGIDGPPPAGRPAPAGAYVDGNTWDAITTAGIDPAAALANANAGPALAKVGALVITGPTGINHADVVILM